MEEVESEAEEVSTGSKIVVTVLFALWLVPVVLSTIYGGWMRGFASDSVGTFQSRLFNWSTLFVLALTLLPIISVWIRSRILIVVVTLLLFPFALLGLYLLVVFPFGGIIITITILPWYLVSCSRWGYLKEWNRE